MALSVLFLFFVLTFPEQASTGYCLLSRMHPKVQTDRDLDIQNLPSIFIILKCACLESFLNIIAHNLERLHLLPNVYCLSL